MANNREIAINVLKAVGGKENVASATHCMTRLRFNLKNEELADDEIIKNISGVLGIVHAGGQIQVVIGQNVPKVYAELCNIGEFQIKEAVDEKLDKPKEKVTWKTVGSKILDYLAGSMTPIIPIMLVAGMFRAISAVLGPGSLNIITEKSDLYILFDFLYDAGFYFLPIFIGYTAAKKLGASQVLGMFMGAILISPKFIAMVTAGTPFTVFGIPTLMNNYSQSVLPIILSVWMLYNVEKIIKKITPDALSTLFVPFFTMLIMIPISLCLLAPAGAFIGAYVSNGLIAFRGIGGFLALAVVAALWQFLVMTGMHLVLIMAGFTIFAQVGHEDFILVSMGVAFFAALGMALGAALRIKEKDAKSLSVGYLISGLVGGVTEPTLYGIGLKYKRPFIGMTIGGFVGGTYAGIMNVGFYTIGAPSFLAPLVFAGAGTANFVNGTISYALALIVSAIIVFFFGFKKNDPALQKTIIEKTEIGYIYAPMDGEVIPLKEIQDGVFSEGMLGKGFGMKPTEGKVYAPFDGEIILVINTKHAIALKSCDGIELLIHVGMDTVKMDGKGFNPLVKAGDKVKCGQSIMAFSISDIEAAGYVTTTAIIVTNSDGYANMEVPTYGVRKKSEKIIHVV